MAARPATGLVRRIVPLAAAAVVWGAALSAGCVGLPGGPPREFTDELLVIVLTPTPTEVPYEAWLPTLFTTASAHDGTPDDLAPVAKNIRVASGTATVETTGTNISTRALHIVGTGRVELRAERHIELPTVEGTETYLQNQWTQPGELPDAGNNSSASTDALRPPFLVVNATTSSSSAFPITVNVTYSARSAWCSRSDVYNGKLDAQPAATAVWARIDGASRAPCQ